MGRFRTSGSRLDHRALRDHKLVAKWYEEHRLRSPLSAEVHLRQLGLFCFQVRLTPAGLVGLAKNDPDGLRDLLIEYATYLKAKGRLPSYSAKIFSGIGNFLSFNRVHFDALPKLRIQQGESLVDEKTPTPEELRGILANLSPRGRAALLLQSQTGVRPGAIGNVNGRDGLTCGDLPELRLERSVRFDVPPNRKSFVVRVPARLSKNALGYVTFGPLEEAGEAIIAHLAERKSSGQELTPRSPLIALSALGARGLEEKSAGGFLTTKSVTTEIRRAIRIAAVRSGRLRPYAAGRAYYSTQALIGRMDHDVREATLGHDLGVSGRYNLAKRLPDHVIDAMRDAYEAAMPALLTTPEPKAGPDSRTLALILEASGVPKEAIDKAAPITLEKFHDLLGKSLGRTECPRQQVVPEEDLPKWLAEGWLARMPVDGSKFVIERGA